MDLCTDDATPFSARRLGLPPAAAVVLRAPGRLHLGFLDPGATRGRRFGSLGLVVDGLATVVGLERLDTSGPDRVEALSPSAAAERERAAAHLRRLREAWPGGPQALRLRLGEVLPAHAGFGSGTQLALAVGRAYASLQGWSVDTATLARLLGRGRRSGIGLAGFDHGGLLLDGGPGADGSPAPLLSRLELPPAWRVLLVLDPEAEGLNGAQEKTAIEGLAPFPAEAAAALCHAVLMQILPAAAVGDFQAFAAGIGELQQRIGAHFAPAQGGLAYTSPAVGEACAALGSGHGGCGQSSWGPTGFVFFPSAAAAESAVQAARARGRLAPQLVLKLVTARAQGASLQPGPLPRPAAA